MGQQPPSAFTLGWVGEGQPGQLCVNQPTVQVPFPTSADRVFLPRGGRGGQGSCHLG